jgi:DNA repair exonuclease SbcCD ATPase subunit
MSSKRLYTCVALGALVLGPGLVRAQDEGVKQVQRLVKSAGTTVQSIVETKNQLQKTLDAYDAVLAENVKDRRSAYKDLQKEMDNTEKKREQIKLRTGDMDNDASTLFQSWADSAKAMDNADLRKRTEDRLAETKSSYAEIHAAGAKAVAVYDPFMKSLKDQVEYLGHDLNASAVASLKPDAAKLHQQAKELFDAIDETVATANTNIGALRPE